MSIDSRKVVVVGCGFVGSSSAFAQRRIVKDFLIKFTKKVPEAPYGS